MIELCLQCYNILKNENKTETDFILSREDEFCNFCGKYKRVIIKEKPSKKSAPSHKIALS